MNGTAYITRDITKATALWSALVANGFMVQMTHHDGHTHIVTNADATQWAVIRASINIPSSNATATVDMPDPDNVVIPDTLPDGWAA